MAVFSGSIKGDIATSGTLVQGAGAAGGYLAFTTSSTTPGVQIDINISGKSYIQYAASTCCYYVPAGGVAIWRNIGAVACPCTWQLAIPD